MRIMLRPGETLEIHLASGDDHSPDDGMFTITYRDPEGLEDGDEFLSIDADMVDSYKREGLIYRVDYVKDHSIDEEVLGVVVDDDPEHFEEILETLIELVANYEIGELTGTTRSTVVYFLNSLPEEKINPLFNSSNARTVDELMRFNSAVLAKTVLRKLRTERDEDDAPPLTKQWFENATLKDGNVVVREGNGKSVLSLDDINIHSDSFDGEGRAID